MGRPVPGANLGDAVVVQRRVSGRSTVVGEATGQLPPCFLPVLPLGAPSVDLGFDPGGPVGEVDAGLDLVAVLAAGPRPPVDPLSDIGRVKVGCRGGPGEHGDGDGRGVAPVLSLGDPLDAVDAGERGQLSDFGGGEGPALAMGIGALPSQSGVDGLGEFPGEAFSVVAAFPWPDLDDVHGADASGWGRCLGKQCLVGRTSRTGVRITS